jgi:hypothetical protein
MNITPSRVFSECEASSLSELVHEYVRQVLSYGQHWEVILAALQVDPECCLANVLAADYWIAKADTSAALRHLAVAQQQLSNVSPREQLYHEAFTAWLSGHTQRAYDVFVAITLAHPDDLFAVKRGQLLAFLRGDAHAMLAIISSPAVVIASSSGPFYNGMLSFALEQTERATEAEQVAKQSSELGSDDPWADHGVAHACLALGKLDEVLLLLLFMILSRANGEGTLVVTHMTRCVCVCVCVCVSVAVVNRGWRGFSACPRTGTTA